MPNVTTAALAFALASTLSLASARADDGLGPRAESAPAPPAETEMRSPKLVVGGVAALGFGAVCTAVAATTPPPNGQLIYLGDVRKGVFYSFGALGFVGGAALIVAGAWQVPVARPGDDKPAPRASFAVGPASGSLRVSF